MFINLSQLFDRVAKATKKKTPGVLAGVGIGGMLSGTIFAVKATPKALVAIEEEKRNQGVDKLTVKDAVRVTWRYYIPSAVFEILGAGCMVGSCKVSERRNAVLATAYSIAESNLRDYREQVVDMIGEKKESKLLDNMNTTRVCRNPPPTNPDELAITMAEGNGTTLCYDAEFGRWFYSSIEKIDRAINKLNWQMNNSITPYISLNDFYREIDLPPIEVGDRVGWNSDRGLIEIHKSSALARGNTPCFVFSYIVSPDYNYY